MVRIVAKIIIHVPRIPASMAGFDKEMQITASAARDAE